MPAFVRRLIDRLQEEEEERQRALAAEQQRDMLRRHDRAGSGLEMVRHNLLGLEYGAARAQEPSLRPPTWVRRVQEAAEEERQQRARQPEPQRGPMLGLQPPVGAPMPAPEPPSMWDTAQLMGMANVAEQGGITPQQMMALSQQESPYAQEMLRQRVESQAGQAMQQLSPGINPDLIPDVARGVAWAEQKERETLRPYTRPAGRFAAESLMPGGLHREALQRIMDVPGVPGQIPQMPGEQRAGGVGEVAGEYGLLPSNLLPIPVVDPLVARGVSLLGRGVKAAATRFGRRAATEVAEQAAPIAARQLPVGPEAAPPVVPPLGQAAAPAPPAQAVPAISGGEPLTGARLDARQAAPEAISEAMTAKPGREVREAWRKYDGSLKDSALQRQVWGNEMYDAYDEAGIKLVRGGERQSDKAIQHLEIAFGDEAERGRIANFASEEQPLAQGMYDRIDAARARLEIADPEFDIHRIEEYIPHLFKRGKPKAGQGRGFQLAPGFKKPRKLEGTLAQILDAKPGLDLVTWDPVAYVNRFEAGVDNYIASLEAIRNLRAVGLIVPEGAAPNALWRTPKVSGFRVMQKLQGFVAEPKVARGLEQMFGESAFDQHGVLKVAKGARENLFRIKVFGGLFQGIDYSLRSIGLGLSEAARLRPKAAVKAWFTPFRAVGRTLIPGLDAKMLKTAAEDVNLTALRKAGISSAYDPSISEQAIRGLRGFVPESIAGRRIPGAGVLGDVVEFMSGGAYQKFHRDVLDQAGLINLEKHLKRGVSLDEAARLSVEETNVFFSSIPNWQSAVKSSTGRDLVKFPIFAIGEFEAWFRLPVQAPAGFAGIIGATVIAAEMINKMSTGHWLTEEQLTPYSLDPRELKDIRKGPQGLFKAGVPGVDYNTKFLRPELPWEGPMGRKLYLDILGQADTPFRFALDPLFAVSTRLGQLPRAALDVAAVWHGGTPAFGKPVEGLRGGIEAAAQQLSPIAVTGLAGTERGRIGAAGASTQVGGVNVMAEGLRDVLARRFEEIKGRPFNRETDYPIAEQEPELKAILDEMQKAGLEYGAEGAVKAEERRAFLADTAMRLRLADKATAVLGGDIQKVKGFREAYQEYSSTAADVAARDYFGSERPDPETPEGQAYRAYQEIDPWEERFQDPETGEVDWGAFMQVKDAAFARLPSDLQEAINARERTEDEDVNRLAGIIKELRSELDPYYEREQGRRRTIYRKQNGRIDAILYLTGSVSKVYGWHRDDVAELVRSTLGVSIDTSDVPFLRR